MVRTVYKALTHLCSCPFPSIPRFLSSAPDFCAHLHSHLSYLVKVLRALPPCHLQSTKRSSPTEQALHSSGPAAPAHTMRVGRHQSKMWVTASSTRLTKQLSDHKLYVVFLYVSLLCHLRVQTLCLSQIISQILSEGFYFSGNVTSVYAIQFWQPST